MEIQNLVPVDFANQRVLTYKQIADGLDCTVDQLRALFSGHKDEFQEGVHYFNVTGDALRALKKEYIFLNVKGAKKIKLWTSVGFLLLSKLINTPEAWDVFREIGETLSSEKHPILDAVIFNKIKIPAPKDDLTCVYALELSDDTVKIGMTNDFERRQSAIQCSLHLKILREYRTPFAPRNFMLKIERACQLPFQNRIAHDLEYFNITFEEAVAELNKHTKEILASMDK